jgi:branched-subunit amino acid transport protein
MKTELVWLALLMGAVTYPWRAVPLLTPGMHRLPSRAQEYFRLVGPAVLAALAAVDVMVILDAERTPSFHVGVEWLAVGVCLVLVSARRGLLVGLVAAALITTVVRAINLG